MILLRRLLKSKSLRMVNVAGLAVVFACMLLSYAYVAYECSYDRFHTKADRIYRLSLRTEGEPVDVRIHGFETADARTAGVSGIESVVRMYKADGVEIRHEGHIDLPGSFYFVSGNFLNVFDLRLIDGDPRTALDTPDKVILSRSYARRLFGEASAVGRELTLAGGRLYADRRVFVGGVYEDLPETSHFHSDLFVRLPDEDAGMFTYVYLLLSPGTRPDDVARGIAANMRRLGATDDPRPESPMLFPLTDIHLRSHFQREHEPNGNILYLYLIIGANILLLVIVLFNLWLNAGLIFAFNRRYYQLLRLNGASSRRVLIDEMMIAGVVGGVAVAVGWGLAQVVAARWAGAVPIGVVAGMSAAFVAIVVGVSVVPVVARMSSTRFLSMRADPRGGGVALSGVKYMLIGQYAIVLFVTIVSVCISRQVGRIRSSQVGGREPAVLVMQSQPIDVTRRFGLLRSELLKQPGIEAVTTAMQLPGSAIRDGVMVQKEGESEDNARRLAVLVVGDDFLPFFRLRPVAGEAFGRLRYTADEEERMLVAAAQGHRTDNGSEQYVVNRSAAEALGFRTPNEAIGQQLRIRTGNGGLDYIDRGTIVGVTDDFNYTTSFEATQPLLIVHRAFFQHCLMVRLDPDRRDEALDSFRRVWAAVNPGYPAQYTYLSDVYDGVYASERYAERLTRIFAALCLAVATLGLIIVMAFVVRRRTKEIGIRKINGARPSDIVRMLNYRFVLWIGVAFLLAAPAAYLLMTRWLENFAAPAPLDWWLFGLTGLGVLVISVAAVSWQSWRAATINPVDTLKLE